VTPDDPAALATAIDTFFAADPAVQAQRTQTMRARVTHEFSLARMMAAIDALVMRLTC
jgi:glycosyltransferase involved in cell wall biosynthesis